MRIFSIVFALALLAATPQQANAGTLGCLLGAAAGGFGGAQIGKGTGRLMAVGAGTLLGCGLGSSIQNSDQRRYQQPQYQRPYQPRYQPQYGQRSYRINYNQPHWQRRVPYSAPRYYNPRPIYRPQPRIVYVQPQQQIVYAPPQQQIVYAQPQQRVVQSNRYCREYQSPITVGNKTVEGYGQTCSYDGGKSWDLGPLQPAQ